MKLRGVVFGAVLAVGPLVAQSGSGGGSGNLVFPGSGHAPTGGNSRGSAMQPALTGGQPSPSYVSGARIGGGVPNNGMRPGNGSWSGNGKGWSGNRGCGNGWCGQGWSGKGWWGRGFGTSVFAYPVYVGGPWPYGTGLGFGDSPDPPPPADSGGPPAPAPPAAPPVILNQYFGTPPPMAGPPPPAGSDSNFRFYQAPTSGGEVNSAETPYYLIAFKDHTIYSAIAYYVDGQTLHYFTEGNVHNQVSLSLVDRQLTEQLNRERNVSVKLPQ